MRTLSAWIAIGQSIFYLGTGIWPLFNRRSFEKVTGSKTDFWLVKTAGVLIAVIGASLGLAGLRERVTRETALLGVGAAAGLSTIDVVYVSKKRISPVYLLDAVAEAGLIAVWAFALLGQDRDRFD